MEAQGGPTGLWSTACVSWGQPWRPRPGLRLLPLPYLVCVSHRSSRRFRVLFVWGTLFASLLFREPRAYSYNNSFRKHNTKTNASSGINNDSTKFDRSSINQVTNIRDPHPYLPPGSLRNCVEFWGFS